MPAKYQSIPRGNLHTHTYAFKTLPTQRLGKAIINFNKLEWGLEWARLGGSCPAKGIVPVPVYVSAPLPSRFSANDIIFLS